jgi:phage shock protein PspC (stress-responsive transcriptional regulator)
MEKKLYRSRSDRMIAGVCGGLGEYLNVDPVWIRLGFVLLLVGAAGAGFWAYLILWIIIPEEGRQVSAPGETVQANVQEIADRAREFGQGIQKGLQSDRAPSETGPTSGPIIVGVAFILLGAMLLLNQLNLFWWLRWSTLWPLFIIFIGAVMLFSRLKE